MLKRIGIAVQVLGIVTSIAIGASIAHVAYAVTDDKLCEAKGSEGYSCMQGADEKKYKCVTGLCAGNSARKCCALITAAPGSATPAGATPAPAKQSKSTGGDVGGGLDATAQSGGLISVSTEIPSAIGKLIGNLLGLIGALMLAYFVYGGVRWMTAGGDSKATQDAITIIRNAVIGMMIIGMSYLFADFAINAVQNTLNGQSVVQQTK